MNVPGLIVSIVAIVIVLLLLYWMREKTPAPVVKKVSSSVPTKKDDLTLVEGIGPKIQALLESNGIHTYGELAKSDAEKLRKIMLDNNLRIADPTTWPKQGQLLAEGKMDELKAYQDKLKGGREA
jgi:predicted flap endonuclease-1-like 5' DNA nuclease